jgi:hypothetical protein
MQTVRAKLSRAAAEGGGDSAGDGGSGSGGGGSKTRNDGKKTHGGGGGGGGVAEAFRRAGDERVSRSFPPGVPFDQALRAAVAAAVDIAKGRIPL